MLLLILLGCEPSTPWDTAFETDTEADTETETEVDTETDTDTPPLVDLDGDGYTAASDCDDADPAVNPDAHEVCNDIDDDCNGLVDDNVLTWPDTPTGQVYCYPDMDGDGYGDHRPGGFSACLCPPGYADNDRDCNDGDPAAPGTDGDCIP